LGEEDKPRIRKFEPPRIELPPFQPPEPGEPGLPGKVTGPCVPYIFTYDNTILEISPTPYAVAENVIRYYYPGYNVGNLRRNFRSPPHGWLFKKSQSSSVDRTFHYYMPGGQRVDWDPKDPDAREQLRAREELGIFQLYWADSGEITHRLSIVGRYFLEDNCGNKWEIRDRMTIKWTIPVYKTGFEIIGSTGLEIDLEDIPIKPDIPEPSLEPPPDPDIPPINPEDPEIIIVDPHPSTEECDSGTCWEARNPKYNAAIMGGRMSVPSGLSKSNNCASIANEKIKKKCVYKVTFDEVMFSGPYTTPEIGGSGFTVDFRPWWASCFVGCEE
jgi:hypothetical protein